MSVETGYASFQRCISLNTRLLNLTDVRSVSVNPDIGAKLGSAVIVKENLEHHDESSYNLERKCNIKSNN